MKLEPVKRYRQPKYPTRDYLVEHPELLKLVPKRWRNNRLVLSVLSATAFLIFSSLSIAGESKQGAAKARVAPIFEHGVGQGAIGCVVVNPPVFLSEAEARKVIIEEAKKAGLDLRGRSRVVKNVQIPLLDEYHCDKSDTREFVTDDLVLDGYDKKHNVSFEYINEEKFTSWSKRNFKLDEAHKDGTIGTVCASSVSGYDFKNAAEKFRVGLSKRKDTPMTGVFYEPACVMNKDQPDDCTDAKAKLRIQVRDFIGWLKAQGVI
ncbi:MAG: hypothetical protein WC889_19255 [Myxococcota bacterium]|jgi:hypothetical protein